MSSQTSNTDCLRIREMIDQKDFKSARQLSRQLLQLDNSSIELIGLSGITALRCGEAGTGLALLDQAAALQPNESLWAREIGKAYAHFLHAGSAKPYIDKSGTIKWPDWVERGLSMLKKTCALTNREDSSILVLAAYHKYIGKYRLAAEYADFLLKYNPNNIDALLLSAEAHHNLRDIPTANERFESIQKIAPDHVRGQWLSAMHNLLLGNFSKGWKAYESRKKIFGLGTAMYPFPLMEWQGEDVTNKRILIHGEQGLGDEVMFAGLINDLIDMGAIVTLAASPVFARLFLRSFPDITIYPMSRAPQAVNNWRNGMEPPWFSKNNYDVQCASGSLPRWLRNSATDFPQTKYLIADAELSEQFSSTIQSKSKHTHYLTLGLNITANLSTGLMGLEKSIPIEKFEFLNALNTKERLQVVGLHRDNTFKQALPIVQDFSSELIDFDATAALICACDIIVTVDTSVAHVAAALGKETWVLLKFAADWRYELTKNDNRWYPNMRLFRQTTTGDWSDVLKNIEDEIQLKLAAYDN